MSTATSEDSSTDAAGEETEPCKKCRTEIPVEAERCPQCGYEPKVGILGGILMWISLMIGSTMLAVTFASLVVTFGTGFDLVEGLTVSAFTGVITLFFAGIVWAGYQTRKRKPTDGTPEKRRESREQARERGEEIGESIAEGANGIGSAIITGLPMWTWSAGTILAALFSLSVWATATTEGSTAMSVGVLGGLIFGFFSVVTDAIRINLRDDDLHFRWWFWSILAALPLFGWVFCIGWLLRKRQKTGSALT